jgi:transcriptional regulator CtsR
MSNKINISGGGTVTIGNVVQGDHVTTGNLAANVTVHVAVEAAKAALQQLADQGVQSQNDVAQVKRHVDELGAEAQQPKPDVSRARKILEAIQKNFGWALPIVKDLVLKAWPALSVLI